MFSAWLNTLLKGLQMIWNKKPESNRTFETYFQKQLLIWCTSIFSEPSVDAKTSQLKYCIITLIISSLLLLVVQMNYQAFKSVSQQKA